MDRTTASTQTLHELVPYVTIDDHEHTAPVDELVAAVSIPDPE